MRMKKLIFQRLISPNCQGKRRLAGVNLAVFRKPNKWKIVRFSSLNSTSLFKFSTRFIDYERFRNRHFPILAKPIVRSSFSRDSPGMGGKSGSLARRAFKVCKSSILSSGYLVCSIRKYSSYGVVTEYAIWRPDRGFSGGRVRNKHTQNAET